MKKIIFTLVFIISGASLLFSQDTISNKKSMIKKFKLPEVTLKTLDGKTVNSSQLTNNGKPIIISFWAMWCTNCLKELKAIQEVYTDWQDETGVKLIAISIDDAKSVDKVKPFVNGKNWDYDVFLDTNKDFYRALNVNQVPHTFVVNGNGEVVWQHVTYTEGSEIELYNVVKKIVAGENIGDPILK
ncbi:MAG: TlpA family protein disulfide reductase [Bacteroidetes bacterium]|nr:TlpA family protein disulfide reductase [Bacteroidota bacterium]